MINQKDNSFTVTNWTKDNETGVQKLNYIMIRSGTTKNSTVTYKVHYDKNKTYNDAWTFYKNPCFKVEILDGGDNLPELLYRSWGNGVRSGFFMNTVLAFTNPNYYLTYGLEQ